MSNTKKLIVTVSANAKNDISTVAFTVANAALSKGIEVGIFLSSDGVELSRDGATEFTHIQPFKKLNELIEVFGENGGVIWACAPCFNHRGLNADETVKGTQIVGAGPMLDWLLEGAQTLTF